MGVGTEGLKVGKSIVSRFFRFNIPREIMKKRLEEEQKKWKEK